MFLQDEYQEELIKNKPNHYQYIQRLQRWRDRFEAILDARPRLQPLAILSHYLTEFQYSKIDEIEIPGQYTEVSRDALPTIGFVLKVTPKRIRIPTSISYGFKNLPPSLKIAVQMECVGRD